SISTSAHGVSASGQIVGSYEDTARHGFLLDQGIYSTLDLPGWAGSSHATGINASGQIVGYSAIFDGVGPGFLLQNGSYTTLDGPDLRFAETHGINASGQIVGYYLDRTGPGFLDSTLSTSFLLENGNYTALDVYGTPTGINNAGQIVGSW